MKNILVILFSILSFGVFAQKAIYTDYDGDGIVEYNLYSDDGSILETGFYYNSKRTGTWTSYYPNGKKQIVAKFKGGVKHGKWFMYDQSGRLITEVTYKDGKKISASQHAYASVK